MHFAEKRLISLLLEENEIPLERKKELEDHLETFLKNNENESEISRLSTLPERAKTEVSGIREMILRMIKIEDPESTTEKEVEQVSIANIFLGRIIRDEDEWTPLLSKLDLKVKEILKEGKDVEIR